jgi:predicted DNA-binding transcriptional regulator YafY
MRADRLVATLLLMQARGQVTARELSDELEVSVATARRDLEALSTAGIPVYPQRGRGGGWALLGGARTDLSGLSFPEMQALFVLIGPAAAVSPDAKSALRKLVRALPETFRAQAEAASTAVVLDQARWGHRASTSAVVVNVLRAAVVSRVTVRIGYRDASPREVEPWGLVDKNGIWYLIAGTERGQRTFRLDRMTGATATDVAFEPPATFDLAEAWNEITTQLEARRALTTAEVTLPEPLLVPFRDVLGARHVEVLGDAGGGRLSLRVSSNTPECSPGSWPDGLPSSMWSPRPTSAQNWRRSAGSSRPGTPRRAELRAPSGRPAPQEPGRRPTAEPS